MAAVETNVNSEESSSFDFSSPWNMSDVVLLVEGERFNVHRSILAIWSPVFAIMFTADFKERSDTEIPLPGKKADEIRELLQVIYPTMTKPISQENCYFLLELAEEYQILQVKEKCEEFLMGKLSELDSHNILVLSQKYDLKKLFTKCKNQMKKLTLEEITKHEKYQEISKETLCDVLVDKVASLEVKMSGLQSEKERLEANYTSLKRIGKEKLESVIVKLGYHAMAKHTTPKDLMSRSRPDIQGSLSLIHNDGYYGSGGTKTFKDECSCLRLDDLSSDINKLYSLLQ